MPPFHWDSACRVSWPRHGQTPPSRGVADERHSLGRAPRECTGACSIPGRQFSLRTPSGEQIPCHGRRRVIAHAVHTKTAWAAAGQRRNVSGVRPGTVSLAKVNARLCQNEPERHGTTATSQRQTSASIMIASRNWQTNSCPNIRRRCEAPFAISSIASPAARSVYLGALSHA
jgi:hypothetical protein